MGVGATAVGVFDVAVDAAAGRDSVDSASNLSTSSLPPLLLVLNQFMTFEALTVDAGTAVCRREPPLAANAGTVGGNISLEAGSTGAIGASCMMFSFSVGVAFTGVSAVLFDLLNLPTMTVSVFRRSFFLDETVSDGDSICCWEVVSELLDEDPNGT